MTTPLDKKQEELSRLRRESKHFLGLYLTLAQRVSHYNREVNALK